MSRQHGDVRGQVGPGAGADAGIGDDDIGHAMAQDEVLRGGGERRAVGYIERIDGNLRGQGGGERLHFRCAPGGQAQRGARAA